MYQLPYTRIWCLDTEFREGPFEGCLPEHPGHLPTPICLVAKELISGQVLRFWYGEFPHRSPFAVDAETLYVTFFATAEWGIFKQLGWPLPTRIVDLSAEFRNQYNGVSLPLGRGLLGAAGKYGLGHLTTKEVKKSNQDLARRGGPYTAEERRTLTDYCTSDVAITEALFHRMLPDIQAVRHGFSQALIRGYYTTAVAEMEHRGLPTDLPTWTRLRDNWDDIKLDVVREVDADFGVYEGTTFRQGLFLQYLATQGITWPRTETGQLSTDDDTFCEMSARYPQLHPLRELHHAMSDLRAAKLAVGPDGRNRLLLSPFGQKTSRNNPKSGPFLLGKSVWLRSLIKPDEGRAVVCCDWSAQEIHIAAALSGDQALLDVLATEDPYLRFAVMAGIAPPGATKASHKKIRDLAKTCVLGNSYGQTPFGLSKKADVHMIEAEYLHRRMAVSFPRFYAWADRQIDNGSISGHMTTVLGWRLNTEHQGPNTLRNFPMQANGAEMLRLGCCRAMEAGVEIIAPHHDAIWIEAGIADVDDAVEATRLAMAEASKVVLDGYVIPTDATIVRYPDRWSDEDGRVMWDKVMGILGR
jgi:DNA polymerase I